MILFANVFKMQCRRLFARSEARYALLALLVIATIAFLESCLHFYGSEFAEVPSASYGWAGNMDAMQIQSMRVLYYLVIFLIASSVFADSFFVDARGKIAGIAAARCSVETYLAATGLLAFLGGFVAVFLTLALSQLLAFVAFPAVAAPNAFAGTINTPAFESYFVLESAANALFPSLYVNHPYLNNFLFIAYAALWAGIMSLASFAVSLFTYKSRLIVLGAPTLLYLVTFFAHPAGLALQYYLYPYTIYGSLTQVFFFCAPIAALVGVLAAISIALRRKKDLLL